MKSKIVPVLFIVACGNFSLSLCAEAARTCSSERKYEQITIEFTGIETAEYDNGRPMVLGDFALRNSSEEPIVLPIWKVGKKWVVQYPDVWIQYDGSGNWQDMIYANGSFLYAKDIMTIPAHNSAHFKTSVQLDSIDNPSKKKFRIAIRPRSPKICLLSVPFSGARVTDIK